MSVDIQKLKAYAERCVELDSVDPIDAVRVISVEPAAVLELIAEIESLRENANVRAVMSLRADVKDLIAKKNLADKAVIEIAAQRDQLKTENTDLHATLHAAKGEIERIKAENEALRESAAVSAMRIKELDLLFGRYILAMRAAVIEDEHGKTSTTGMDWIFNSLAGPGELPPEEERDAQAYFDREIVAVGKGMEEVIAFHDQRRVAKAQEASKVAGKWTKEDEAGSKAVYEQWSNLCGYVPWVEGGNSLKQDEARRLYAAIEGKVYCHGR